ncbi:hypothetical protein LIER_30659 [Lithospermum erythrorhizon]|uniref:Endonuclease/exonuclease/phosphatase domain-containing protein n=1 Tax=Lithospermum erythrorhizon TaxID=34254 RepID=A0AAV3RS46_LITER
MLEEGKGGLALLWPRELKVTVISFSSHHIEALVEEDDNNPWRFVGFYGLHEVKYRCLSWELLKFINNNSDLPTIFLGDFNEVLDVLEQSSTRRQRPSCQVKSLKNVVEDCKLMDIGFFGYPFTWCNNFLSPYSTRARLDTRLVDKRWKLMFPKVEIIHLTSNHSDHLALLLRLGKMQEVVSRKKMFRFEDSWCLYEESKEEVAKAWNSVNNIDPGEKLFHRIKQSRLGLLDWKRTKLRNVQGAITNDSKRESVILAKEIDRLRETNYIYWQQRSRIELTKASSLMFITPSLHMRGLGFDPQRGLIKHSPSEKKR